MSEILIKSNIPLRIDQLDRLTHITTAITALREKNQDNERITKATIIRTLIDNFDFAKLKLENIRDEATLKERVAEVMKNNISLDKFAEFEKQFKDKLGEENFNEIKKWFVDQGILQNENQH